MDNIPKLNQEVAECLNILITMSDIEAIIRKCWKQPKCPSVNEWIKKLCYIYTMEYYSAVKKKKILPFVTAWMDLENIMLSEISQLVKDKYHMISLITRI